MLGYKEALKLSVVFPGLQILDADPKKGGEDAKPLLPTAYPLRWRHEARPPVDPGAEKDQANQGDPEEHAEPDATMEGVDQEQNPPGQPRKRRRPEAWSPEGLSVPAG